MKKQTENKQKQPKRQKVRKEAGYRRQQKSASIYFLLWTAFSLFAFIIGVLFTVAQIIVVETTYKAEAEREVSDKGQKIERALYDAPDITQQNFGFFVRVLSNTYDVGIVVCSAEGEVLFPQAPDYGDEELIPEMDFTGKIATLKNQLEGRADGSVVYEGDGEYVYGAKLQNSQLGGEVHYLYVSRSLALMQAAMRQLWLRMLLASLFLFLLAFAVSSAISGWLIKPITEMTEKAKQLAAGDFSVDFHGADYGLEMVELADAFNYARDEISKADEMQKQLIANVSHDFKTPLTMIKGYASMIIEISGENKQKREKHAQVIIDEADRLTSLVGDVLELSKLRAKIDELKCERVDMSAFVYEVMERFNYLKDGKGYQMHADVDLGLYTLADKFKIGQALYNLIGNAVNYTGEDKTVFISLKRRDENTFRFSVRDTGEGIAGEELATIWDRYYRSSNVTSHKRPVNGTGLGLSIVKTVFERHKFSFGVESEVGKGSTFYVDFPLYSEQTALIKQ